MQIYPIVEIKQKMEDFWQDEELVFGTSDYLPCPYAILPSSATPTTPPQAELKSLIATKQSSQDARKRMAGQRSREKKKSYVKQLEEQVRELTEEAERQERELAQSKDQLLEALRTSTSHVNEHTHTFAELERNARAEDPDLDRINLLIDIIRSRIGASGKERHANLAYAFKQAINSIFPAIYRYVLNTAHRSTDIFAPDAHPQSLVTTPQWTQELFTALGLQEWQVRRLAETQGRLRKMRSETMGHVGRLNAVKQTIMSQGETFEEKLAMLRCELSPVQSALFTVFCERNKLRREFIFEDEFEEGRLRKAVKSE